MMDRIFPRVLSTTLALSLIAGLGACDGIFGSEDDAEVFVAELDALNNSGVDGTATFRIEDGRFVATVQAAGMDAVLHPQHIHAAAQCPTMALDRANDGDEILDVLEAVPAYGPILVPLDNRLAEVMPGDFPQGNLINYAQSVGLQELVTTLRNFQAPNAAFTGLGPNEELNLSSRTVVLHGTSRNLPPSVQSIGGLPAQVTLPIACGRIVRVDD